MSRVRGALRFGVAWTNTPRYLSDMSSLPTPADPVHATGNSPQEIVTLDDRRPWQEFAGIWQDNPDFDVFRDNVAALRREHDEAETRE